ncbi:peroxisomal N(1)-acetyl-spermine/spermidine oxidase isoform X2 [Cherax quadricarinatus]|uniref:peroxisomal N(1)-acetyl-spermine/spermidine oxidase isoform X2 n=1 Tax=Cherax quadricarinatus TaxID=27406 RepID=UPI00387EA733
MRQGVHHMRQSVHHMRQSVHHNMVVSHLTQCYMVMWLVWAATLPTSASLPDVKLSSSDSSSWVSETVPHLSHGTTSGPTSGVEHNVTLDQLTKAAPVHNDSSGTDYRESVGTDEKNSDRVPLAIGIANREDRVLQDARDQNGDFMDRGTQSVVGDQDEACRSVEGGEVGCYTSGYIPKKLRQQPWERRLSLNTHGRMLNLNEEMRGARQQGTLEDIGKEPGAKVDLYQDAQPEKDDVEEYEKGKREIVEQTGDGTDNNFDEQVEENTREGVAMNEEVAEEQAEDVHVNDKTETAPEGETGTTEINKKTKEKMITLAEKWNGKGTEDDSLEEFNPEVVEYKLQRIMDYYNPELQGATNHEEQRSSVSLWRYLLNYVTGSWQDPPPTDQEPDIEKEEKHPCDGLPGDYNHWLLKSVLMEVVVVGGGVAGLAALKTLTDLNIKDLILLEATSRLGGRIKTLRHSNWVMDEGPDVIEGSDGNPIYKIAQELDTLGEPRTHIVMDDSVVTSHGEKVPLRTVEHHASIIQQLRHDVSQGALQDYYGRSLGDFYAHRFKELWSRESDADDRKASMYILHQEVSNKFGVNSWFNMSARDADNFISLGQDYTWKGGMDGLIQYLMDEIPQQQVRLLSPVCKVFWEISSRKNILVVTADGSSYLTDYLIVTLPLGVLRERHLETFVPALPNTFSRALQGVQSGAVNRISLGWVMPWWGNKPFSMQIFWKDYYFPKEMEWVSSIVQIRSLPHHQGQLEMTLTGEASLVMEKLDPETIISHLVTFLRTINRDFIVPLPLFFHRSRWCHNLWSRGSYQSFMTNTEASHHLQDRSALTPKLINAKGQQSLFFGGEHSSSDRYGTVDGALLSGARAAHWVVEEHIRRSTKLG